jgi:hypothetical protein
MGRLAKSQTLQLSHVVLEPSSFWNQAQDFLPYSAQIFKTGGKTRFAAPEVWISIRL